VAYTFDEFLFHNAGAIFIGAGLLINTVVQFRLKSTQIAEAIAVCGATIL
jgi:hypothetical protein